MITFENNSNVTIDRADIPDQNAFFIVVYVHHHERIGVTAEQLVKERIKLQEEKIVKLFENKQAHVYLHGNFLEEDQGQWVMYYQHLSIQVKDKKARYAVVKSAAGTFQLKELAKLV